MLESEAFGTRRYPLNPTKLERTATPKDAVKHILGVVETSGGQAWFVTLGRSGRRLIRKLSHRLPDEYEAQVFVYDGDSELPTARFRFGRYETRLLVRRKDLLPHQPPRFPASGRWNRPRPLQ